MPSPSPLPSPSQSQQQHTSQQQHQSQHTTTSHTTSQQQNFLRQRRTQILRDQQVQYQQEQRIRKSLQSSNTVSSGQLCKLYLVVGAALLVTLLSGLQYTKPQVINKLLFGKTTTTTSTSSSNGDSISSSSSSQSNAYLNSIPYYFATLYPPTIMDIEQDLPRFFRTYSIATDENIPAQNAALRVIQSRNVLKSGVGKLKVYVKAWDESTIPMLLERNLCGNDFTTIYNTIHGYYKNLQQNQKQQQQNNNMYQYYKERKEDLFMWCLLTTRMADGVFLDSIEFISPSSTHSSRHVSPLMTSKHRGMIVRRSTTTTIDTQQQEKETMDDNHNNRYSHTFYLHPRNLNYTSTLAIVPSKVLNYLMNDAMNDGVEDLLYNNNHNHKNNIDNNNNMLSFSKSLSEYRTKLQEYIYELIHAPDGNYNHYLELKEVCPNDDNDNNDKDDNDNIPKAAIAKHCPNNNDDNNNHNNMENNNNNNNNCCYFVLPDNEAALYIKRNSNDDDDDNDNHHHKNTNKNENSNHKKETTTTTTTTETNNNNNENNNNVNNDNTNDNNSNEMRRLLRETSRKS